MKKLFYFSAMALSISLFIYSCEKENVTSGENITQKGELNAKSGNPNTNADPNGNAVGFFELDLPKEIRNHTLFKDEDLLDYEEYKHLIENDELSNISEVEITNQQGEPVSGEIRVTYNTTRGQIQMIEASEKLRREAGINEGYLTRLSRDPNIDLIDIIDQASPEAACELACQESYRENVFHCSPEDEFCRKHEWKMYRKCSFSCSLDKLKGWFKNITIGG